MKKLFIFNRIRYKLFIPFFVLVIFILTLTIYATYVRTVKSEEIQTTIFNEKLIGLVNNELQIIFSEIDRVYSTVISTSSFKNIMEVNKNSTELEFFNLSKNTLNSFSPHINSSKYIHSIHYIDNDKSILVSAVGGAVSYSKNLSELPAWMDIDINDVKTYIKTHDEIKINKNQPHQQVFTVMYDAINLDDSYNVYGKILISVDIQILADILQQLNMYDQSAAYIMDNNNDIIYFSDNNQTINKIGRNFIDFSNNYNGNKLCYSDKAKYTVIYSTLKLNDWKIINIIPYNIYLKNAGNTAFYSICIGLVGLLCGLLLTLIISKKYHNHSKSYQPQ